MLASLWRFFVFLLVSCAIVEVRAFVTHSVHKLPSHAIQSRKLSSIVTMRSPIVSKSALNVQKIVTYPASKKLKSFIVQQWSQQLKSMVRFLDISTSIAAVSIGSLSSSSFAGGFLSGGLHAVTGNPTYMYT
jgi:ABC-type uncharacterized transport system auxiliary subunit